MRQLRLTLFTLLGVVLVCGVAYARYTGVTAQGYEFHASANTTALYVFGSEAMAPQRWQFPTSATLTVRVRDRNKQPVDGVPVTFGLERGCKELAQLSSQSAVTHRGIAQATLKTTKTTGVCRVTVQVDNLTQKLTLGIVGGPPIR